MVDVPEAKRQLQAAYKKIEEIEALPLTARATHHVKLFLRDPNGFETHVEFDLETTGDETHGYALRQVIDEYNINGFLPADMDVRPEPIERVPVEEPRITGGPKAQGTVPTNGVTCPDCDGPTVWKEGVSEKGNAYKGWFCTTDRNHRVTWVR